VVRIAGRIDRIDVGAVAGRSVFNVIDYKTGRVARFSREAAAAGTALQLPLYAMAAQEVLLADREAVPWQAGYWLLQQKGFTTNRSLVMWGCRGGRLEPEAAWEELRKRVAKTVAALAARIRQGQFPVHSADQHCTRFCPFRTICRIGQVRSLEKKWQFGPEAV
jgi:ATP-dependent helicase/DNAse subunit B